jgi:hypothetical protein
MGFGFSIGAVRSPGGENGYHLTGTGPRSLGWAGGPAAAYATSSPSGTIPEPLARGTAYQTMIAPEIQVEATEASVYALSLSVRWQVRDGMAVWASARTESLAPTTYGLQLASGFRPDGSRTATFAAFGVALTAPGAQR